MAATGIIVIELPIEPAGKILASRLRCRRSRRCSPTKAAMNQLSAAQACASGGIKT